MNKKIIIFVLCGLILIIAIAVSLYLIIQKNNINKINNKFNTKKITIEKSKADGTSKVINITDKKTIKKLAQICKNISNNKNEEAQSIAIKNDIKINFNNGIVIFIQLNYDTYCFLEDNNTNSRSVVEMPIELLNYVNSILKENNI